MRGKRRIALALAVIVMPLMWNFCFATSAGEAVGYPARQPRGYYYIKVRFTGLMVFTLVRGQVTAQDKMRVSLHSKAEYHNVTIAIVDGPPDPEKGKRITYPLFLVRDAKPGGEWTLNAPGHARWSSGTPFSMKQLHATAVEEEGELQPTLTINAGDFKAQEPVCVLFKNDNNIKKGPFSCPTAIVATIKLGMNEVARFEGPLGTFEFPKPRRRNEVFNVQISNTPDLRYIEKHHHFKHYYDGARVIKNGKPEKVEKGDQFEAMRPLWQVTETRPCIPITY